MQSIAVFNNKGGVGKTTLLCNLAGFLALKLGKKILIVDADPQCNATQNLFKDHSIEKFYDKSSRFTIYSIVRPLAAGRGYSENIEPITSDNFGLDVVIGDPRLSLTEDLLAKDWSEAIAGSTRGLRTSLLFHHFLSMCDDYDFVIFDMGPSLGSINRSVLISADYYLTPMSIDIFSLRAIDNISRSLENWKKDLAISLERLSEPDDLEMSLPNWKLKFAGYVTQQYTAKTDASGQRRAVRAFDRILKQVPKTISKQIVEKFQSDYSDIDYALGSIPNLHSLIPLSQTNRVPIFALKAADGVVGAHFSKVREYENIIKKISSRLLDNLASLRVLED